MSDNSTIRLQFHPDGTFKIMQITDSQDSGETSGDTVALISAALDAEKPDFVVFTGDQVSIGQSSRRPVDSDLDEPGIRMREVLPEPKDDLPGRGPARGGPRPKEVDPARGKLRVIDTRSPEKKNEEVDDGITWM